jgi:AraC family transcriptional regulator of adaptative response / DNA-3-methyladenine glycosylase II
VSNNVSVVIEPDAAYAAILARDPRFDGLFFVGVSTTGIYCRPICPAKTPGRDRCKYFSSAAAAELEAYRPCLRCRPELAPGRAHIDAVGRLASIAFSRIDDGALNEMSVEELAAEFGVTGRHLRRSVERAFGVTPIQLAQTQRLLTAKRLLTDTQLSIGEVAFAAGFSSLRRFNALFQERYRLSPTAIRRSNRSGLSRETLVCETAYSTPFDWHSLLSFLGRRAVKGVEEISGGLYRRTLSVKGCRGIVCVACDPEKKVLRIEISIGLATVLPQVVARIKRLFDTATDPLAIIERLGALAANRSGLRVPGAVDGFEVAVRGILGQQVSVAGATTIAGRLVAKFGDPLETPWPGLTHTFPSAARLAGASPEEVSILGMPRKRGETIVALARAVASGEICLKPGKPVEPVLEALKQLPGIGDWTAQYIAMRALSWPDAFPHSDLGVRKALGMSNDREVLAFAEKWRPWRAYAALHLWHSLEEVGSLQLAVCSPEGLEAADFHSHQSPERA